MIGGRYPQAETLDSVKCFWPIFKILFFKSFIGFFFGIQIPFEDVFQLSGRENWSP